MKTRMWIAAASLGGIVLAVGCGSESARADGPLAFPDSVGGLETRASMTERFDRGDDTVAVREQAVEKLSAAYGGAEATSQAYADESLTMLATVYAVDASSPALWSPQDNEAAAERLSMPTEQVMRSGDGECLVAARRTSSGDGGQSEMGSAVVRCQAVRDGFTVLLPEVPPPVDPDTALRIVNDSLDHFRP